MINLKIQVISVYVRLSIIVWKIKMSLQNWLLGRRYVHYLWPCISSSLILIILIYHYYNVLIRINIYLYAYIEHTSHKAVSIFVGTEAAGIRIF